jgi:hypothetical protein
LATSKKSRKTITEIFNKNGLALCHLKLTAKYLIILLCISCKFSFAQTFNVEGTVINALTSKPIEYANIQDKNKSVGVSSDSLGKFKFIVTDKNTLLTVSCVGYQVLQQVVSPNSFVVFRMTPMERNLAEIIIKPADNPAWEIMQRTLANANINNPLRIPKFRTNHYSKIGLNGEILKFLAKSPKDSLIDKEKSLLLVENLGNFFQRGKDQKDIINFTISSFPKNYPINLFTNTQINPLGFYEPLIQINLNQLTTVFNSAAMQNQKFYVNPLNEKTFSQYKLQLTDTLINESDTTYTIHFEPLIKRNFNALKGYLKINTAGYAIQEVFASNADSLQSLNFEINQKYQKNELYWYPELRSLKLDYRLQIDKKDVKFIYQIEDYFGKFETDFNDKEVNFDGTNRLILPKADTISKAEFEKIRSVELQFKEKELYKKAEITGQKAFSQKILVPGMALLKSVVNNGLMAGPFFLLYNQLDYNRHEKLRLGLGIQNDLLRTPRWRIYVGAAYGLEDRKWKYEGILSYHITKNRYNKLEVYGGNDIRRPGQNPLLFANYVLPQRLGLNLGREDYLLDNYKKLGLALFFKPFAWTQFKLFFEKELRNPVSYSLAENAATDYNHTGLSMRFARKESMTRTGYFENVINPYFPIVRLNVSRFNSNKIGQNDFWRGNLVISHQMRTKRMGKSMTILSAGNSWGVLPFQYLFNSLSVPLNTWGSNSKDGFQMLSTAELGYNNYVSFSLFHDFEKSILKTGVAWFQPEFMLGNKLAFGKLTQSAPLVNQKPVNDIKSGVFEASLNIRNILKVKILGARIGLGVNLIYDYSPIKYGDKRFGVRPFILPVFF